MKKIKLIILFLIPIILGAQIVKASTLQKRNQDISKYLIERYNKLRSKRNLSYIQHDTILDNVAMEIQSNRKYRKSMNLFNENSIRFLLYNRGVIDYQYEIIEALDKDTASAYKSFLLNDPFSNLRVGFCKKKNRNILLKTKSFLKFNHWEVSAHSPVIDGLHNKSKTINIGEDSAKCFMKTLKQGKYTYYTTNSIPLKSDRTAIPTKKPSMVKLTNKSYDLVFTLRGNECNKYLIIVNEKNEKVTIMK